MIWYLTEKKAMINQIEETLKTKVECNDWIEQFMCKQGKLDYHLR